MNSQAVESVEKEQESVAECPECGGTNFDRDSAAGEVFCRECGVVVEEDNLDHTGPRTFSGEDSSSKKRSGSSITYTRHDKGITTEIGSGSLNNMSGEKRGQYYRLRKWHSRSSDSKSRNVKMALRKLNDLVNQLNLPESVEEEAARMYDKAVEEDVVKGRKIEKIATSVLFIVSRNQGIPRTMKEFAEAAGIKQRELGRNYRHVSKEMDVEVDNIRPEEFVSRYASELGVDGKTQAEARRIIQEARSEGLTSGRSPDGIAASAIYLAAKNADKEITQREISDVVGVTEVTIRKGANQLDKINEDKS